MKPVLVITPAGERRLRRVPGPCHHGPQDGPGAPTPRRATGGASS